MSRSSFSREPPSRVLSDTQATGIDDHTRRRVTDREFEAVQNPGLDRNEGTKKLYSVEADKKLVAQVSGLFFDFDIKNPFIRKEQDNKVH